MSRRKIDFTPTVKGQEYLKNSFLVNLDKKNTEPLATMTVIEDGPYTVKTFVNDRLVKFNYYNHLEDAKNYAALVLTHFPRPDADIHIKIANFNGQEIEDYTPNADFTWFKLTSAECERLLPNRMINSDLHRGSYHDFNVSLTNYKPFEAKGY